MKLPKIQVSSDTPTALEKFQETKHGKSYKKKTLNQGKNDGASLKRTQDKREHFQWRQIKTAILASEKFGKRVGSGSYIPEDISSSTRSRPSQRDLRRRLSVYDVIQEQTTPENGGSDESNWEERSSSCSRRSGGSSRRSQSLYDVLEDDDWLRRMSLPSWALKEDIEAFLKNLECQERRTSLQSPDKPRTKRASTVALKRWSQRQRIGRERRPKTTALKLFRTVARVAILCAWACGNSYQRLEKMKRDTLPINQYMEEYYESTPNLSFDPSYYKVKKDQGLSLECKKLLQKPPTARTSKDIEMISENLRWNHAYMASPKKIQGLLCRHAWFESFGPHRTILRQGDRAYAVYFIVEGEALDSVADSKGGTTCTPLYRGVSFGRHRSIVAELRTSTVISKTNIELLVISSQDFEDIFMAEGLKNALGSDYNNFLGNVAFLKGWPVQKLSEYPSSCMFQYFNAGRTMVRDSNDSDWIYIVKSGSISVMKKLRHVVPRRSLAWERENDIARRGPNVTVPFRERRRRQKILPPLKLPDVPRPQFHSQFELQIKMEETVPGAFKENDRLGILDYDSIVHEYKSRLQQGRVTEPSPREEKRIRRGSVMDETEEVSEEEEVEEEQENEEAVETRRSRFPEIHKTTRGVFMSASKPRQRRRRSESQNKENLSRTQDLQQEQDSDNEWDHGSDEEDPQYLAEVTSEKPESEIEHQPEGSLAAPPPTKPVFIMVQVLEKGQYFGVGDVVFRETQPSFSVVSNGAECLLISKAFFRQHSTESIINALRKTETPYPTEAELQEKLQVNTDWLSYRTSTYHSMVDPILDRKARRRQYTLGYSGQYNFRTGPT